VAIMRAWLAECAAPVLAVGLVLFGIVALGRAAKADLPQSPEQVVQFLRLEPNAPAGLARDAFLREVQYVGDLPDGLDRADESTLPSLRTAFERHPWVEGVERLEVAPHCPVHIRVRPRSPVLAVEHDGQVRVLDRFGVILPSGADSSRLPTYASKVTHSAGPTGTTWEDRGLQEVAATVGFLRDVRDRLNVRSVTWEHGDVILWTGEGSRILWGKPAGRDQPGEDAVLKRDRLLELLRRTGENAGAGECRDHDLRTPFPRFGREGV
jgi:hypothetical protein